MTMTATIGRSKSYYHTIMTMTAIRFTSPYDSCHGHDCVIVGFTSTYGSCHGDDCMIVGFTSTSGSCHGDDDHDSHHR
jgi:hypothetical protein